MLRLTTFGGLALSRDGIPLTGAAAQRGRLSILALLATAGAPGISRDKMLLHFWPESDEERARHALKQAVYSLRRELGTDDAIVGTASLSLNPAIITSDVRDFEGAIAANDFATAAALYGGPFLDGVHLKDSVEFDRWSAEQRARYAHMWSSAVENLAADAESRGEWRAAAGHWRMLASAEPLSGRLTGALIRCLAESGDVGAALQQFRIHESLLREEVGTSPEADVTALADAIKAGTWQRSPSRPRAPIAASSPPPLSPAAVDAPADAPTGVGISPAATAPATPMGARLGVSPARRKRRRLTALSFVLGMLFVTVTAMGIGYWRLDPEMRAAVGTLLTRTPLPIHPDQIVIGVFENHTGDVNVDELAEKAADWFTREFQQAQLHVVDARTRQYDNEVVKLTPVPLRSRNRNIAIARENGSAYVVVGNLYTEGDSLEANVSVVDVARGQPLRQWSAYGSLQHDNDLIRKLLGPSLTYMANLFDSTAGTVTVSSASPPTRQATTLVARAWERFFQAPGDTASVFKELDSAAAVDPAWATPVLMRTYILDVKSVWAGVDTFVRRVRPLRPRMSPIEQAALDLFESDLRGEAAARLAIAKRLKDLSPGSAEMPLLTVVSLLYAGRPDEAVRALDDTKPDYGMNLLTPAYWEWRTEAQHEAGPQYAKAEEESAKKGFDRFPRHPASTYALVRVYASRNDPRYREFVDRRIPESGRPGDPPRDPTADRQDLQLLAGRELRAHGFSAAADSLFRAVASEIAGLPPTASHRDLLRQAHALYEAKDYPMARAAFAGLVAVDSLDIESEGRLATAAWYVHDTATVKRIDTHLAGLKRPYMMGMNLRWRANIAAVQGRTADALTLFEQAVRQGHRMMDTPLLLSIHLDGDYVAIRGTPPYRAMLKSLAGPQIR